VAEAVCSSISASQIRPVISRGLACRATYRQDLLLAAHAVVVGHLNPDGMLACPLADIPFNNPLLSPTP